MNVGVIGLGLIGSQIAIRLVLKGHNVTVFNRDKSKVQKFRATSTTNLRMANLPKEIGDTCDMAIICVKDYLAVVNVSFSSGGMIETKNSDLIVIQCSTISPEESSSIADLYSKKHIKMLSAPMLGGTTTYDLAEPILKDLSTQIFYVGSDHRTASILKLAININIALIALALAEGLVFARGTGVDPGTFMKILNSTYFKTGMCEKQGPRIINDDYAPSFYLMNMVKDLDLAMHTAYSSGLNLPISASAQAVYKASEASGLSEKDYTSVASYILGQNGFSTFLRDQNGVKNL